MMKCVGLARLTDVLFERSGGRSPMMWLVVVGGELKESRANFNNSCKAAALNGYILAFLLSWLLVPCGPRGIDSRYVDTVLCTRALVFKLSLTTIALGRGREDTTVVEV